MKKKKAIIALLIACLLCVNLLGTVAKAEDSQPTTYIVQSATEFREAVKYAHDGDIISVLGEIDITVSIQIGSESEHLTIERSSSGSSIIFNAGTVVDVVNTTFEGNGKDSSDSWVTTSATATFTDCTFQNCGSSDNLSSSGIVGGAVKVQSGSCVFNNCIFSENYALIGGHIAVKGSSQVELNNCTLTDGGAVSNGGAVAVNSSSASCEITGGEITGNRAYDFGGGVSNAGTMTVTGVKIYANSATNGGADITTKVTGSTILTDTVEELNELFSSDGLQIAGWVCDYDFETAIYIPDVEPTQENALLKLEYAVVSADEPEQTEPTELSADDTEESGGDDTGETAATEETNGTDAETPTEPSEEADLTDTEETNEENSADSVESTGNTEDMTDSENSADTSNADNSTHTDNSSQVANEDNSVSTTSTSTVTTGDTISSTDRSSTVDNSVRDSSNTATTTTTNNYYQAAEGNGSVIQPDTGQNTYIVLDGGNNQVASEGSGNIEQGSSQEVSASQQNISIDAKGVDCTFEMVDGVYTISVNANRAEHADNENSFDLDLYQVIQILLLVAILICSIWKPKNKEL